MSLKHERYLNPESPRFKRLRELLVGTDLSRRDIARQLGLSAKSVKSYCSDLYKLEKATRGRLTLMARKGR